MLLLADDALPDRRAAVRSGGPLSPLCDSLVAELAPWLGSAPPIPAEKALLSRLGGRCASCGATLAFDPGSPREHGCPSCGRVHSGALHDRAWIMPYQLWRAERAVHGALLHLLRNDSTHATFARDTIQEYAARYSTYPNSDNVLGPTRLFFSTYLESIWLLQICFAADFLGAAGDRATVDVARAEIIEPSRAIIASYDEGMSNRQVWNNAALIAASLLMGERGNRGSDVDALAHGPSGVEAHLSRALLPDGTWYEGENYHQFALRGLWYCVTMLEVAGVTLRPDLRERFQRAFAAPFVTALPDFTMPSRKDSQYAVSLRQWRIAELTELGYARRPDPILGDALARMYDTGVVRRETGRSRSTADVERNTPGGGLTRADLGWRALLHARSSLPHLARVEPRSAILESQGYAVFRREGGIYVGFEFGQSGGGHGHPDRLNLTLYQGDTRWLDDMGTGSYVDPSLHWYRSTLAHNAPLVNGKSQPIGDGTLLAWDEREGLGWIVAEFRIPGLGVRLERAVVVAPEYLIEELRWTAAEPVRVDVPWHLHPSLPKLQGEPVILERNDAPEDGWSYLRDPRTMRALYAASLRGERMLHHVIVPDGSEGAWVIRAQAPGQPFGEMHGLLIESGFGREGRIRTITGWMRNLDYSSGNTPDTPLTVTLEGERHVHRRDEKGWHVELHAAGARSSIDLAGFRKAAPVDSPGPALPRMPMRLHRAPIRHEWLSEIGDRRALLVYELGEAHYRRSEPSWVDAGAPAATVAVGADGDRLAIYIDVRAGEPVFAPADATNPYDNEHADTMRAGVQLYASFGDRLQGWMLVPEEESGRIRVRPLAGDARVVVEAQWRPTAIGYEMRVTLARPTDVFSLDVIINETVTGRERRRGQLVMSGGRGEFVYLRGDRHDAARLIPMVVAP